MRSPLQVMSCGIARLFGVPQCVAGAGSGQRRGVTLDWRDADGEKALLQHDQHGPGQDYNNQQKQILM
ncbi:MAG: hypothetical protein KF771_11415 [Burkholderiales bacterium]|nr:hypothetical protein [Burkholderiales bacterium]